MKEKLESIKNDAKECISKIENLQELQELKVKILGKKGELTAILKGLGSLSPEERPIVGSLVNETRKEIEDLIFQNRIHLFQVLGLQQHHIPLIQINLVFLL